MFLDSDFQRKMTGQCQQEVEQQQEKNGALEKHDDRLAKSLLRRRAQTSNALFHFFALNIIIGGMWPPAALTAQPLWS
jgi:hypothetical protein